MAVDGIGMSSLFVGGRVDVGRLTGKAGLVESTPKTKN